MNDLSSGDLGGALHTNALLVVAVPVVLVLWIRWVRDRWSPRPQASGPRSRLSRWAPYAFLAVLAGFAVLRNTPWGSGLAAS